MKKMIAFILMTFFCFGAGPLFAAENASKPGLWKQIVSLEKRGAVNVLTWPAEAYYIFPKEKKAHPKAWLLTYIPRLVMNMVVRLTSGGNDMAILPWYVAQSGDTPLTRRFELPDYVWERE